MNQYHASLHTAAEEIQVNEQPLEITNALMNGQHLHSVRIFNGEFSADAQIRQIELPTERSEYLKFVNLWESKHRLAALKGAAFSLLLLPLTGCGGGGGGTTTNDDGVVDGLGYVVDGPIKGAYVGRDINANGTLENSERLVQTGEDGTFDMSKVTGTSLNDYKLLSTGGIDIYTGKSFSGVTMSAPTGSLVISPITTLINSYMATGMTAEAAQNAVKAYFGITDTTDLTKYNPASTSVAGTTLANQLNAATQQIVQLTFDMNGHASNNGSDEKLASIFASIINTIVQNHKITDSSTVIQLLKDNDIANASTETIKQETIANDLINHIEDVSNEILIDYSSNPVLTLAEWKAGNYKYNTFSIVDSVANLIGEHGDLSGATSVTAQVTADLLKEDLSVWSLDNEIDTIDLNGVHTVLSAEQGTRHIIDSVGGAVATVKIMLNKTDLSDLVLDPHVTRIDLNGKNAILSLAQEELSIVDLIDNNDILGIQNPGRGGSITLKLLDNTDLSAYPLHGAVTSIDLNGFNAILLASQLKKYANSSNTIETEGSITVKLDILNAGNPAPAIDTDTSYNSLTNWLVINANDNATGDNYYGWYELISGIDLNGQKVFLTLDQSLNWTIKSTQASGAYVIRDTVANLTNLSTDQQTALTNLMENPQKVHPSDVIVKLGAAADLVAGNTFVILDSHVTSIDLAGFAATLSVAQGQLELYNGVAGVTVKVMAGETDLSGKTFNKTVTDIDLNGYNTTLNVAQAELLTLKSGTTVPNTITVKLLAGGDVDLTDNFLFGKAGTLAASTKQIDLNGQANVILRGDQAADKALIGEGTATVKIMVEGEDLTLAGKLDSQVTKINLNGHNAVLTMAQAKLVDAARTDTTHETYAIVDTLTNLLGHHTGDAADIGATSIHGATSVTVKLAAGDVNSGANVDLSSLALDNDVVTVDLGGQSVILSMGQIGYSLIDNQVRTGKSVTVNVKAKDEDSTTGKLDLSAVSLKSLVTNVELNGHDIIVSLDQAKSLLITDGATGGTATVKVTSADTDLSNDTFKGGVTDIDINGLNVTLSYTESKLALHDTVGTGSVEVKVLSTDLNAANTKIDISADGLNSLVTKIDLNGHDVLMNVRQALDLTIGKTNGGTYAVVDTVANLTGEKGDLSGAKSVTARAAGADISTVILDNNVTNIDLNGTAGTVVSVAQVKNYVISDSQAVGGVATKTATVKVLSTDDHNLTSIALDDVINTINLNGQQVTLTANQGKLVMAGTGTATVIVQSADDMNLTGLNVGITAINLNGHDVILSFAQGTAASLGTLTLSGTGNVTLRADGVADDLSAVTLSSAIKNIDLNGYNDVVLNVAQSKLIGVSTNGAYSIVDTVAHLTGEVGDLSKAADVTVKLSSTTDLTAVTLDTDVKSINLNGQVATLTSTQAKLKISDGIGGGAATIKIDSTTTDITSLTFDTSVSIVGYDLNGQAVTMTAAQANGKAAVGTGTVLVKNLDQTLNADLSGIAAAAKTVTAEFNTSGTFTGNLNGTSVNITAETATMTVDDTIIANVSSIAGAGNLVVSVTSDANIAALNVSKYSAKTITFNDTTDAVTISVAQAGAIRGINGVFDGTDNVTISGTSTELLALVPSDVVKLGGRSITLDATNNAVKMSVAQATALLDAKVGFNAGSDTITVADTTANLLTLASNANIGNLLVNPGDLTLKIGNGAGNFVFDSTDTNIVGLTAAQATTLLNAGIIFNANDAITVTGTDTELMVLSANIGDLSASNIKLAVSNAVTDITLTDVQAQNLLAGGTSFNTGIQITVTGLGANLVALNLSAANKLGGTSTTLDASDNAITMTKAQVDNLLLAGGKIHSSDAITIADTAAVLQALTFSNYEPADLGGSMVTLDSTNGPVSLSISQADALFAANVLFDAHDVLSVNGTGAQLAALTFANYQTEDLGGSVVTLNASDDVASLTSAQADALTASGLKFDTGDAIKISTTIATGATAEDAAQTTYTVAKLGGSSVTLDAFDDAWSLTIDQATVVNTKIKYDASDAITITGTAAQLSAITFADYQTADIGGSSVKLDASDNAVTLTPVQATALFNAGLKFAADDVITVTDTGANIVANLNFANAQTADLGGSSVTLDATDNVVSLTANNATNLFNAAGPKFAANDVITITGQSGQLAALTHGNYEPADLGGSSVTLDSVSNTVSLTIAQADSVFAANLMISATDVISVTGTGAALAAITFANYQTGDLGGVSVTLDADDNAVAMTSTQADALVASGLKFASTDLISITGTTTQLMALNLNNYQTGDLGGSGTFTTFDSSDNAVTLTSTQADALVTAGIHYAASDAITIAGTGAELAALQFANYQTADLGGSKVTLNASDNAVTLTSKQATALGTAASPMFAADDLITVSGTGAELAALTFANYQKADLGGYSVTLDASDNVVTLTTAQATALKAAAGPIFATNDVITISGTDLATANFANLQTNDLGGASVTLDSTTNAVSLTKAQADSLTASGLKFATSDAITLADTGATLAGLTFANYQAADLGGASVQLDASDDAVSMTSAQADALVAAGLKFASTDVVSITGTSAALLALDLTKYQVGKLGGKGTIFDATDNVVSLTSAQADALVAANIHYAGTDAITVTGTGAALSALTYANYQVADLGGSGTFTTFDASDNAVSLTMAQANLLSIAGVHFAANDAITITGTGAELASAAFDTYQTADLGGASVTLNASDNVVSLTSGQAAALTAAASPTFAADDVITITGTTSADTIVTTGLGGSGAYTINSGDGNDTITGGNGIDTIDGGKGDDIINGGGGADKITGGAGADDMTGGAGNDVYTINSGDTGPYDGFATTPATALSHGIDVIHFGAGDQIDLKGVTVNHVDTNLADGVAAGDVYYTTVGVAAGDALVLYSTNGAVAANGALTDFEVAIYIDGNGPLPTTDAAYVLHA
ncbi:MAG: hypothetical protein H7832_02300 [Magnetococcus sp. DMHC-6]